jgi:hypothetical protein
MHGPISTEVLAIGSKDQATHADSVTVSRIGPGAVLNGNLPRADLDLEALIYGSSTSALHLSIGAHDYDPMGAPLPAVSTATVWHLKVRSGALGGEWQKGRPVLTQDFLLGGACMATTIAVGPSVDLPFLPSRSLVALGPNQAFLGGHDAAGNSAFALLGSSGTVVRVSGAPDLPADSAFTECGVVWLLSRSGAFAEWNQTGFGFDAPAPLPARTGTACVSLDGNPLSPFEIYAERGADLLRYSSTGTVSDWQVLHLEAAAPGAACNVLWVAPGEVFALTGDPASVIRVVNTTTHSGSIERVLPADAKESLRSLAQSHTLGMIAGTDRGHVYRRLPSGAWTLVAGAPDGFSVDWMTDTPQGVLLSDQAGPVLLLTPSGPACATVDTGGTIDARPVVESTGVVVVGRRRAPDSAHGVARWLTLPP